MPPSALKQLLKDEDPLQVIDKLESELKRRQEATPQFVRKFYADPLGFVMWAWPWGQMGTQLEKFQGPDKWQEEFLIELGEAVKERAFNGRDPVSPIRMSRSSGHGIGKGVMAAWLTTWILATRRHSKGTVTANTGGQLETKTWATIQDWFKRSRVAGQFNCTATAIRHKEFNTSWFCTPQTCREENSESFAGQHAATSTSFYIFDEASAVPDTIWNVAEGGLTDGEPMMFVFGNPTRSSGKFFRINFGSEQHRWRPKSIDASECMMPNKEQIREWTEDYGYDSDFVRVRVRGLPPRAGDLQFISSEAVFQAQKRVFDVLPNEPLVAGVDLARGGADNAVIWFRRGDDARSIPAVKIPGAVVRNSELLSSYIADMTTKKFNGLTVAAWFLDGGGPGGPIIDRMKGMGHQNMHEVQFGGVCPDPVHYANMRAWMWAKMRDHLEGRLAIPPKDKDLEIDLTGVGLAQREGKDDRILLESKKAMAKRGLKSPDSGDALALTYAKPVLPAPTPSGPPRVQGYGSGPSASRSWMG